MDQQGLGWNVSFSVAAGASNIAIMTITVKDNDGKALAEPVVLDVWLSDAATGIGVTTHAADTLNVVSGGSGKDLGILTAAIALRVITSATGVYTLEITDTTKTLYYVAASVPMQGGRIAVSSKLATADFG